MMNLIKISNYFHSHESGFVIMERQKLIYKRCFTLHMICFLDYTVNC